MKIEERINSANVSRSRTMTPHGESKMLWDYTVNWHEFRSVLLDIDRREYYDKDWVGVLQVHEDDLVRVGWFEIDNCHPTGGLFDYLVSRVLLKGGFERR